MFLSHFSKNVCVFLIWKRFVYSFMDQNWWDRLCQGIDIADIQNKSYPYRNVQLVSLSCNRNTILHESDVLKCSWWIHPIIFLLWIHISEIQRNIYDFLTGPIIVSWTVCDNIDWLARSNAIWRSIRLPSICSSWMKKNFRNGLKRSNIFRCFL